MKACQTPPPSVTKLIATSAATVASPRRWCPSSAGQQRDRNQYAELRFVGEQADQYAGEPGPAIEPLQRAAEQRGGQKSVLAVADVDEHGREGERDQQRFADAGRIARIVAR